MEHVRSVIRFLGLELDSTQLLQLERFGEWLGTEGTRAGGIGPAEFDRIERRHLADSLLFAVGIPGDAEEVWDLGTGVGLPGIPLAITLPEIRFVLIDRSQRRVDLLRRFVRIGDLKNCQVLQAEIADLSGEVGVIVTRASLSPEKLQAIGEKLLSEGGVMIVGGSWIEPPAEPGWEIKEIPRDVLDQAIWLLMMRHA